MVVKYTQGLPRLCFLRASYDQSINPMIYKMLTRIGGEQFVASLVLDRICFNQNTILHWTDLIVMNYDPGSVI